MVYLKRQGPICSRIALIALSQYKTNFLAVKKLLTCSTKVKSGLEVSNRAETLQGSHVVYLERQGLICSRIALVALSQYTKITFWL